MMALSRKIYNRPWLLILPTNNKNDVTNIKPKHDITLSIDKIVILLGTVVFSCPAILG